MLDGTIDDRLATVNFLKHLDEPAIGNDECYSRPMKLAWFNEVVKLSRSFSAGTWGHPRYRQLREREPIRFNVSSSV